MHIYLLKVKYTISYSEWVVQSEVCFTHVPTRENSADILTKTLSHPMFSYLSNKIDLRRSNTMNDAWGGVLELQAWPTCIHNSTGTVLEMHVGVHSLSSVYHTYLWDWGNVISPWYHFTCIDTPVPRSDLLVQVYIYIQSITHTCETEIWPTGTASYSYNMGAAKWLLSLKPSL